jgi:hypothetical protein
MAGVMMTVKGDAHERPSLAEAARSLRVDPRYLDPQFGVVLVDPQQGLYTVLVDEAAITDRPSDDSGPFANPGIAHFGRPR